MGIFEQNSSGGGTFSKLDQFLFPSFDPGWVWLVGAGPGAPGLMTLLGYHAIQKADVIVYDALVDRGIFDWFPPQVRVEYAGKRGGKPSASQKDISESLIQFAREGACVLRLKGGDPFMFGRGGEECQALADAGVPFRIVPGVSSGLGGLAYAGIPVTHRKVNHSVLFLTGHDPEAALPETVNWGMLAQLSPVIVLYMVLRNLHTVANRLLTAGYPPDRPVGVVSRATLPEQSVLRTTLGQLVEGEIEIASLPKPAIVVIGHVLDFQPVLDWYVGSLRENSLG